MAALTKRIIEEKKAAGKRVNSAYREQSLGSQMVAQEIGETGSQDMYFYLDSVSGTMKANNTWLLR